MEQYRRLLVDDERLSRQGALLLRRYVAGEQTLPLSTAEEVIGLLESVLTGADGYAALQRQFALAAVGALGRPSTQQSLDETMRSCLSALQEIARASELFGGTRYCPLRFGSRSVVLRAADFLCEYNRQVYSRGIDA